jgi:riboflavin kinase/FMN adenylyltransferase
LRELRPGEATGPSVVTVGKFDGVHIGHRALLSAAREEAATLGVPWGVVTFARHPDETLRPENAPIYLTPKPTKHRLLEEAGADFVLYLEPDAETLATSARDFLDSLLIPRTRPQVIVCGDDFRFGRGREGDLPLLREMGERRGFRVRVVPPVLLDGRRVSSYAIRRALALGDVELAAAMLGRRYSIEGIVVEGRQLGRGLGFPTANIRPERNVVLPATGIYAVTADWEGTERDAVASLGFRPTLEGPSAPLWLEVHVLEWGGNLYGAALKVTFYRKLRDELRFDSVEALREQIGRDAEEARDVLKKERGRP